MNTKTAKELAKRRTDFMKEFVNEFLLEWDAKYQRRKKEERKMIKVSLSLNCYYFSYKTLIICA